MNDIFTPTICWCKGCRKAKDADFIPYIINCSQLSTVCRWNTFHNHFIKKPENGFEFDFISFCFPLNQFPAHLSECLSKASKKASSLQQVKKYQRSYEKTGNFSVTRMF